MKIYRVETIHQTGPYTDHDTLISKEVRVEFNSSLHPTPRDDDYLARNISRFKGCDEYEHDPLIYGFRDIQQARNWFYKDEWIEDLADRGFDLCEIEVGAQYIAFGQKQLAFLKTAAERRVYQDIRELFNYEPQDDY